MRIDWTQISEHKDDLATRIVDALWNDMSARKGFHTSHLDDETYIRWKEDWLQLVLVELEIGSLRGIEINRPAPPPEPPGARPGKETKP